MLLFWRKHPFQMDQDNLTLIATDAEPQEDALTIKCGGLEGSFGFEHLRYKTRHWNMRIYSL